MTSLPLIFSADVRGTGGDDRAVRRASHRGELVRLDRGAYAARADWEALAETEQYRARVIAAGRARHDLVLCRESAAAVWGLPLIAAGAQPIHVLTTPSNGTRTQGPVRRHAREATLHSPVARDGVMVTSAATTAVDLAANLPFAHGVVILDAALRTSLSTRDQLRAEADRIGLLRHRRRFLRALDFADPLSESPGESLSRAMIHELRMPAPELQAEFRDARGAIGRVDFWWPRFRLIGEFDGLQKYRDPGLRAGRDATEVVVAEKRREDRLRACGAGVVRRVWADLRSPAGLAEVLESAGLPSRRR